MAATRVLWQQHEREQTKMLGGKQADTLVPVLAKPRGGHPFLCVWPSWRQTAVSTGSAPSSLISAIQMATPPRRFRLSQETFWLGPSNESLIFEWPQATPKPFQMAHLITPSVSLPCWGSDRMLKLSGQHWQPIDCGVPNAWGTLPESLSRAHLSISGMDLIPSDSKILLIKFYAL